MNSLKITDNYIPFSLYDDLLMFSTEYNKVHWMGYNATPDNPLHHLIHSTKPNTPHKGATAWYNIRPVNPQWHNDIDSYCTRSGKKYIPKKLPQLTHLYYLKSPEEGGQLELETGETVEPYTNRHVSFPCSIRHRVRPYKGNRVSIGIIWWHDTPIYGELPDNNTCSLHRQWEIEDASTDEKN